MASHWLVSHSQLWVCFLLKPIDWCFLRTNYCWRVLGRIVASLECCFDFDWNSSFSGEEPAFLLWSHLDWSSTEESPIIKNLSQLHNDSDEISRLVLKSKAAVLRLFCFPLIDQRNEGYSLCGLRSSSQETRRQSLLFCLNCFYYKRNLVAPKWALKP